MKHLLAAVASLVLIGFAAVVIWSNRTTLTVAHLSFAGGCIAFAYLLALGAQAKEALTTLAGFLPAVRGHRGDGGVS